MVWQNPDRVRAGYRDTIAYSLDSLVDWVKTYADHEPGARLPRRPPARPDHHRRQREPRRAGHDVAHDPAVFDRITDWGWTDGLRPASTAPVWKMDAFRDKFLSAFGRPPTPHS